MLTRAISNIVTTTSNSRGYRKRTILNTIVRTAAAAAATTTGLSTSSAFLFGCNTSPRYTSSRSLAIGSPIADSCPGRSRYTAQTTPITSTTRAVFSKRGRKMFSARSGFQENSQESDASDKSGRPLQELCESTLEACRAVTPAVEAFYRSINNIGDDDSSSTTTKTKADDSVFTIADGLVQFLLSDVFLGQQAVGDLVGEENCIVNLTKKPYTVDDFVVPIKFESAVEKAIEGVKTARDGLFSPPSDEDRKKNSVYQSLTAFIDPIDGTREFSTGKGGQCTICVGFADSETGHPVAGVVYRPLSDPHPTWAAGAKDENYASASLRSSSTDDTQTPKGSLLTTNGRISPFLESLMKELEYERVPSGGAGNKMLMLLEGKGTSYIQDRGVSRWDTCGAQAVLEAHGGILCKLDRFLQSGDPVDSEKKESPFSDSTSYTYRKTDRNLDFVPGMARLTKYNAAEGIDSDDSNATNGGMLMAPDEVKPYANLCGLIALGKGRNNAKSKAVILDGMKRAAKSSPPAFD